MFLVKAKVAATAPDLPGHDVKWAVGQQRYVHESLIEQYRSNPAAWEILSDGAVGSPTAMVVTELTAAQLAALTTGQAGVTYEVTDLPGRPQYRWDGGRFVSPASRLPILSGASAGQSTTWLAVSNAPERFAYQLDSGSTATTFSIDISADGVNSLGQAFTGTWARSDLAEITPPIMFSNPLAKFFRWNVVSGGPLSVSRGV